MTNTKPAPAAEVIAALLKAHVGLPAGPFVVTLACTAAALLVVMAVTFTIALKAGRHSVVDTAWGIGIALVALVSSVGYGQPARRVTLAAASVIWACGWPSTSARGTEANQRTRATATC
jgi:steroid 5-alpha reductase family enzyme